MKDIVSYTVGDDNMRKARKALMKFVLTCFAFMDEHENLMGSISFFRPIPSSEAIELVYHSGKVQVWSEYDDFFVTVKD